MGTRRQPLTLVHDNEQCRGPIAILRIGLTDEEDLILEGTCSKCSTPVLYRLSLAEFRRQYGLPAKALPAPSSEPEYKAGEFTKEDVKFLRSLNSVFQDHSPQEAKP